jgi:hypothetical protein
MMLAVAAWVAPLHGGSVTVPFDAAHAFDCHNADNGFCSDGAPTYLWNTGDYWQQGQAADALPSASGLHLDMLYDNHLSSGNFITFDVTINSAMVGSFTVSDGTAAGQYDFAFTTITGPYLLIMTQSSPTIADGAGSVGLVLTASSFTLSDGAVPEPATYASLALGGACLLWLRLRRR